MTETLQSTAVFAVIVIIRVLLALTLEIEVGGPPLRRKIPSERCP